MGLDVSFWLLNADGSYRCALPSWQSYALSPIVHEPGGVKLDYPVNGRNFAALREHVDNDTDAEIAIWTNGRDEGLRALLMADDSDDVAESPVWSFSGHFGEVRLEDAVIADRTEVVTPPTGEPPTEDVAAFRVYSATAGTIMRTLMQEAQARGTLADIDIDTFDGTTDSNGVAWSKTVTLKIAPGTNYLEVAQALVSYELCEFRMVARSLRMFEPGTMGVDHTVGPIADQITLRKGRDLRDSPRKRSVRQAATDLLIAGAEGLYRTVFDASARARRGRQVEQYRSVGSITDEGTLLAYGDVEMSRVAHGTLSVTHGLSFTDPRSPVPLRDFAPGDWVWSATDRAGGPERLQVVQVTIEGSSDGTSQGSAGLNDLIRSREAQLARRVKGIEGGSTLTGTSQARPVDQGPDTTIPAAPQGLAASSSAYPAGEGRSDAQITASWAAVTTNDDATAIDDLDRYEVQFRYQAGQGLQSDWQPAGSPESGEVFSWSPLVVDVAVDVRVRAVDTSDNASAWSGTYSLTTAKDADPPPVGSAPAPYSFVGLLAIPWDGLGSAGEPMPDDFLRGQVHVSTTADFTADDSTYVDELRGAGTLPYRPPNGTDGLPQYGTTFYARIVTEDRSGNVADASATGSAVLEAVADDDIAEVSIGKLIAGIMSAIMTISGIIRTAAEGARVELDTAGLRCISADEETLFEFSIPNSLLTIVGKLIAGAGVGIGATVIVDPGPPPRILLYPNATQQRFSMRADSTTRPDGSTGAALTLESLNTSGQTSGFSLWAWASNMWMGHKATSGAWQGGIIKLEQLGSAVIGTDNGFLQIQDDGRAYINAGTGTVKGNLDLASDSSNTFTGLLGGGSQWGFGYLGSLARARAFTAGALDVTNQNQDGYKAVEASAFTVMCSAEVKEAFDNTPAPAMDVLRANPIVRYRYPGDGPDEPLHVGPVAENLPEWLLHPRRPDDRDDNLPNSERLDVMSWVSLAAKAIRELDEEMDELRAAAGRPVPARVQTADLLRRLTGGSATSPNRRKDLPTNAVD